jgi:hypothetical protein
MARESLRACGQSARLEDQQCVAVGVTEHHSSAPWVTEVQSPGTLDDDGVLEQDVSADELAQVSDADPEQHRHLTDAELVDE